MTDSNHSSQGAFPLLIFEASPALGEQMPTVAGTSEVNTTIERSMNENALVFSEIDRLLATASAMAQYCERSSVADTISLAMRINRMDFEGRQQEIVARGGTAR